MQVKELIKLLLNCPIDGEVEIEIATAGVNKSEKYYQTPVESVQSVLWGAVIEGEDVE